MGGIAVTTNLLFNMQEMKCSRILLRLFIVVVLLGAGWYAGMQVERLRSESEFAAFERHFALSGSGVTFADDPEKEVDMGILWTVWRMIDQYYVDPDALSIDTLRFGAVKGLVNGIGDPYSGFMTPSESTDFQDVLKGKLEGIGAELTMRNDRIVVVAPLKGSPAAAAGLLPKDIITHAGDTNLENASLQEAVQTIRGPKGTEIVLKIFRPSSSEVLEIPIIRDEITVPSVEQEVITSEEGDVGYLAINQFGNDTVQEARAALRELSDLPLAGLVLDLRFNGGGFLDGAIDVASFFLEEGKIVSVHRRGEEVQSHYATGNAILPEVPLVVLINEGSASASEIVSGSLQDHGRATVMGAKSFGKGTVQEVIDFPGGSSLRITIAKWKTPSGKDLSKEGVTPDHEVELSMEEFADGVDHQKDAAVKYLLKGSL